jgi:hypothetical protein
MSLVLRNHLAHDESVAFTRYLPGGGWDQPRPLSDRPVKVLGVAASPREMKNYGLRPIPPEQRTKVRGVLADLPDAALRWLESESGERPHAARLQQALADGCHVLHLTALSRSSGQETSALVYLEKPGGEVQPLPIRDLARLVNTAAEPPLLCMLSGPCDDSLAAHPFHSALTDIAKVLVEETGVQTAVALTAAEPAPFLRAFYKSLFVRGQVDHAINAARHATAGAVDPALAVAFSQRADDTIFDV